MRAKSSSNRKRKPLISSSSVFLLVPLPPLSCLLPPSSPTTVFGLTSLVCKHLARFRSQIKPPPSPPPPPPSPSIPTTRSQPSSAFVIPLFRQTPSFRSGAHSLPSRGSRACPLTLSKTLAQDTPPVSRTVASSSAFTLARIARSIPSPTSSSGSLPSQK
jgi:hypothetical protein